MCTLGDLLLDVIVRLDSRLAPGDDAAARTTLAPGGQAANVAAWAAALGAEARVVSLVQPEGDRTMASDRGSAPGLRSEDLEAEWLECDALHLSGYSMMQAPIDRAAERAAELARAHGASVSVDLSSWTHIERFGDTMREALARIRPNVVFGNEREWQAIGEVAASVRVVKRGPRGIRVDGTEHAAIPVEALDSTGAGDALAAGFILGGPQLALETAARCVAQVGAMP